MKTSVLSFYENTDVFFYFAVGNMLGLIGPKSVLSAFNIYFVFFYHFMCVTNTPRRFHVLVKSMQNDDDDALLIRRVTNGLLT